MDRKDKIMKIFSLALDVNDKGKDSVFLDLKPHIDELQVRVHFGGWESNHFADLELSAYVKNSGQESFDLIIRTLEGLLEK